MTSRGFHLPKKGIWRAVLAFVAFQILAQVAGGLSNLAVVLWAGQVLSILAAILAYLGRI